ncbi:histone 1o [Aplysia californica]|uniref:Histone 1o n=1 Tax=Aplysia californica TaxID=6500 RepID=I1SKI7_APLCA|nr:histone 1o [Aplysia californica]ABW86950.1 histone 1o [Aplysia californica]
MSDVAADAPAPVQVAKKKKTNKPKNKKPANHPKYSEMIKAAISSLKERGGSSRQAILKYIMANYNVGKDEKVINSHMKMALRAGAKNGNLKQSKGTGASGSFKLGSKESEKPKKIKSPKKTTKPKAVKAKSPGKAKKPKVKKPAAAKKSSTPKKTSVKKLKPAKSAKSKKVKSPKKKGSPKKAAAKK